MKGKTGCKMSSESIQVSLELDQPGKIFGSPDIFQIRHWLHILIYIGYFEQNTKIYQFYISS